MPISFPCSCGTQLRVPDKHAGMRARCPECGVVSPVPDEDSAEALATVRVSADPPASPRAGAARPSLVREDGGRRAGLPAIDPDDLVRKRPLWPFVLVGAAVLLLFLLVGGGLAAWLLLSRDKRGPEPVASESSPPPPPPKKIELPAKANEAAPDVGDLALVPPDAQGFVMVRVAELWKNEATQKSLKELKKQGQLPVDPADSLLQATGLAPGDIERATAVVTDVEKGVWWVVGATVRPYNRADVLGKLRDAQERKHAGKAYHVGKVEKGTDVAVCFVGPRVLVGGPEEGVKRCLAGNNPLKGGKLQEAIRLAHTKRQIVCAIVPPPEAMRKLRAELPKETKGFWSLLDAEVATLSMLLVDDKTHIEIQTRFPSEAKAREAKTVFNGVKALISLGLPTLEKHMNDAGMPEAQAKATREAFERVVEDIAIEQKAREVQVTVAVENKPFEALNRLQPFVLPGQAQKRPVPPAPMEVPVPPKP